MMLDLESKLPNLMNMEKANGLESLTDDFGIKGFCCHEPHDIARTKVMNLMMGLKELDYIEFGANSQLMFTASGKDYLSRHSEKLLTMIDQCGTSIGNVRPVSCPNDLEALEMMKQWVVGQAKATKIAETGWEQPDYEETSFAEKAPGEQIFPDKPM